MVVYLSIQMIKNKVHAGESANWLLAIAVSAVGSLSLYLGFANVSTCQYGVWFSVVYILLVNKYLEDLIS